MASGGYVVYDCDIGTDDAWGLLMLIRGEQSRAEKTHGTTSTSANKPSRAYGPGTYRIVGVTCVQGNTDVDNGATNALRVLDSVDRLDIPVFKGCAHPIMPRTWRRTSFFYGLDGFGDVPTLGKLKNGLIQTDHAVNAMYAFACKYPKVLDFLLVGPLTNFALCITMYGEAFLDKVRNIFIMGGNCRGKGNITKSAEFNFMMDPEAAHIVLERVKSQLVILPWETCIDGDMALPMDWRLNEIGAVKSKAIQLMNIVERAIFEPKGFTNWMACDAMLVAAYLFPQSVIVSSRLYHTTVELTGTHTRGQMVLDHLQRGEHNASIIMEMHKGHYKQIISWTAGVAGVEIEKLL